MKKREWKEMRNGEREGERERGIREMKDTTLYSVGRDTAITLQQAYLLYIHHASIASLYLITIKSSHIVCSHTTYILYYQCSQPCRCLVNCLNYIAAFRLCVYCSDNIHVCLCVCGPIYFSTTSHKEPICCYNCLIIYLEFVEYHKSKRPHTHTHIMTSYVQCPKRHISSAIIGT